VAGILRRVEYKCRSLQLSESFSTGLTDAAFNSPCVDASGGSVRATLPLPRPANAPRPATRKTLLPTALLSFDLTRRGALFPFRGATRITKRAHIFQSINSAVHLNSASVMTTTAGLSKAPVFSAYRHRVSATLYWHCLHGSYARVFLTPYNEEPHTLQRNRSRGLANGSLGQRAVQRSLRRRNQFNVGVEQQLGSKFSVQAEYFWKFTGGATFHTPILKYSANFQSSFAKSERSMAR